MHVLSSAVYVYNTGSVCHIDVPQVAKNEVEECSITSVQVGKVGTSCESSLSDLRIGVSERLVRCSAMI